MNKAKSWDLSKIAAALESTRTTTAEVSAQDMEKFLEDFDPSDVEEHQIRDLANVDASGMGIWDLYVAKYGKEATTLDGIRQLIEDFRTDVEEHIMDKLSDMENAIEQIEREHVDGSRD